MKKFRRQCHGSMLVLNIAIVVGIMTALLLFALSFVRILGANSEQRTAIESAALAAARECSKLVVNTDEFGYVSLSDYAPTGTNTMAPDGFPLPVRSINTIIGTARLDLIVGDKLSEPIVEDLARLDLDKAKIAKDQLVAALNAALTPGGSGLDKDGNTITPYDAALNAYQSNQIRMSGGSSYKANSLQLSLGCVEGGTMTRVPVPKPAAVAPVAPSLCYTDFYKSYVNIPYKGVDFVFGGIGESLRLVDHRLWKPTIAGLAYQIPTIVRAEAVQQIKDHHNPSGYEVKVVACAQPATVHDPLPYPGALSISFPDGPLTEINQPEDLYKQTDMIGGNGAGLCSMLTAKVGDYPIDAGSSMAPKAWPLDGTIAPRPTADVFRVGLYDWLRRAGTKANITSVINMQTAALDSPSPTTFTWIGPVGYGGPYVVLGTIPSGIIHIYKFDPDGVVTYQSKPLTPLPLYASSHEQLHGESLKGIHDANLGWLDINVPTGGKLRLENDFDIYFRDEVRQPGPNLGGKHAGEPLAKPVVALGTPMPGVMITERPSHPGRRFISIMGDGGPAPVPIIGPPNPPVAGPDKGFPPMVQARNDFGYMYNPAATVMATMPGAANPVRPFYETTGTAVDIRFRRVVDVTGMPGATSDFGYIYEVAPP